MINKEHVVCPWCNAHHSKFKLLGKSGLVNQSGSEQSLTCDWCGKNFIAKYEISFRFTTLKHR